MRFLWSQACLQPALRKDDWHWILTGWSKNGSFPAYCCMRKLTPTWDFSDHKPANNCLVERWEGLELGDACFKSGKLCMLGNFGIEFWQDDLKTDPFQLNAVWGNWHPHEISLITSLLTTCLAERWEGLELGDACFKSGKLCMLGNFGIEFWQDDLKTDPFQLNAVWGNWHPHEISLITNLQTTALWKDERVWSWGMLVSRVANFACLATLESNSDRMI